MKKSTISVRFEEENAPLAPLRPVFAAHRDDATSIQRNGVAGCAPRHAVDAGLADG